MFAGLGWFQSDDFHVLVDLIAREPYLALRIVPTDEKELTLDFSIVSNSRLIEGDAVDFNQLK